MDDRVKVAQIEALIREYVYVNPNSVAPANLHGVSQAAGLIAKAFELAAARSSGTGRSEAEAMRERCAKEAEYVAEMGRMAAGGGCDGASRSRMKVEIATALAARLRALPAQTTGGADA